MTYQYFKRGFNQVFQTHFRHIEILKEESYYRALISFFKSFAISFYSLFEDKEVKMAKLNLKRA